MHSRHPIPACDPRRRPAALPRSTDSSVERSFPVPSRRTWALLASLYSTRFLGLMFFVIAMVAILREGGASLDTIGLVYLMGMAWPLKALYAPWIDRHARLLTFWRGPQRRRWLLVLLLYPASASLGYAVIMPSLLDTGWSLADIGLVLNVVGATAGLLVALAYGRLLKRWSRRGATLAAALLQAVGIGGLALPAMAWGSHAAAGAAVVLAVCGLLAAARWVPREAT